MIYDLRFMIAGGRASGVEDFDQLDGFRLEAFDAVFRKKAGSFCEFNPKLSFVRFFKHDGNLVNEVGSGFAAKSGTIIRRHGTTAARDLIGNCSSRGLV